MTIVIDTMSGVILSVVGTCFYSGLFSVGKLTLNNWFGHRCPKEDILDIACKAVSAVHATLTSAAGIIIIAACSQEMKYARHWLTNGFAWFGFPYFVYDLWCMFYVYRHRPSNEDKPRLVQIRDFVRTNPCIVAHHMILAFLAFPTIIYLRRGLGDYVIGYFYLAELSTPCVSFRAIMSKLGLKRTRLYMINGLTMMVLFFFCRVCVFPLIYYKYMIYSNQTLYQVIVTIPIKCNVSSALFLSFQIYWFAMMMRGAIGLARGLKPDRVQDALLHRED